MFGALAMILDSVFGIVTEIGYGPLYGLYTLAMFVPGLAVSVRRLHDVGKSGWMLFIALIPLAGAIYLLVLTLTDSDSNENNYGVNPKQALD